MPRTCLVSCLVALAAPLAAQTVTVQPTGTTAEFRGMVAADRNVVWASGSGKVCWLAGVKGRVAQVMFP